MNRSHTLFTETLLNWYNKHGRKHLPWQQPRTAYPIWLSEIMLQQTQVKTVIPYFMRFIERFPDIQTLANAAEDEVFSYWSGLGYYARARNLHKTAKLIHTQYHNEFPTELERLKSLPGIGPSTAAAIASLAFNQPTAILDGNVKRVLSRYFLVAGPPELAKTNNLLWDLAQACMSTTQCAEYTQAIMDMGATCCTISKPNCPSCPLQSTCQAYLQDEVVNYPQKKIKKNLPVRHEQFLLFYSTKKMIYLEKRPPTGVWGGLWCLPSIEVNRDPKDYAETHYKIRVENVQPILQLKHTLTHFHLHITAVSLQTHLTWKNIEKTEGGWFSMDELKKIGLANPVNKIIRTFLMS